MIAGVGAPGRDQTRPITLIKELLTATSLGIS
jgi:hypothetical protein